MKSISLFVTLVASFAVSLAAVSLAQAQVIAPNPGGAVVVTNSTTSSFVTVSTPVSVRVDEYSTTIEAVLNGSVTVFNQTFSKAFGDPIVQAAILQANAVLLADSASFSAPALTSTNTALLNSSVSTVVTGPPVEDGNFTATTPTTFGPATIMVGENKMDTFFVLSGQTDINVNTDIEYAIPENVITTDTFLTSQSYLISGNTVIRPSDPSAVPEPSTYGGVAAFTLLAGVILRGRAARAKSSA